MSARRSRAIPALIALVAVLSIVMSGAGVVAASHPGARSRVGPSPSGVTVLPRRKPVPSSPGGSAPPPGSTPPPPAGCPMFPATNVWNKRVDGLPVAANSATMIAAIGAGTALHPDFSAANAYGIPFNVVGATTPRSTVTFQYTAESDHVGYPIPASPLQENGSDHHILMIDTDACRLYELFAATKTAGAWHAGSGATWDLRSNALRPATWTSADAAGLPILPGLVRYDEIHAGQILHALRFTTPTTCNGYVYPARHEAGSTSCAAYPPMGLRVRLKASVNISGFAPDVHVLLQALKTYGMLLADNGSAWYISGAPDSRWNDDVMHTLNQVHGSSFEVVDTTGFVNG